MRPLALPQRFRILMVTAATALATAAATLPTTAPVYGSTDPGGRFAETADTLVLTVPGSDSAPGYRVEVSRSPFQVTTVRDGTTVLQSTGGGPATYDFSTPSGTGRATEVTDAQWRDGVLTMDVATDLPGRSLSVRLTPEADRYDLSATVQGGDAPS
jgi:hypothetical protein